MLPVFLCRVDARIHCWPGVPGGGLCLGSVDGLQPLVPDGNSVRLVAADVNGVVVFVVVDAPLDQFAALVPDAEAMIASMTLIT